MSVHAARTPRPARRALLALPAAALLAAAGCTSGSDDQATEQTPAEQTVTVTEQSSAPTVPEQDRAAGDATAAPGLVDCSGERTGEDITGDVRVLDGQTCILRDLAVNGDIDVLGGGRLEAFNIRVTEDIDAEGHTSVLVSGGDVTGSVELEYGGEATLENVRIGGDVESEENSGAQRFEGNTIGGDLECEANDPAPTGGGNQVAGERQGQCATL
ncbi:MULTISPECIES: hypothetical protein [Dietzia]|uniref:DUF3060 family protein n=1 Tax=Dietzia cinnamea TaxID=321318 RepID=A0A4R3ZU61_9ACTN|nr:MULTISPECIES: hypothetical protein [Dietzia]MCT1863465.1 hypothetical protein [Dietzia cinnamea]MCT2029169.1 hypothetical protein [Dietzia cinnamea]MCT2032778.1 hypothetical protein [Dietzia cinnamea]MCT2060337.1 hypothetical protein [Dietzia cinnamea]MCT2075318.1 hypothetical protein [Dietzia cinnamea]